MPIYFWKGKEENEARFEPYKKEINQLLDGEYRALHLEQLNGFENPPLYSIRINHSDRILFTVYGGGRICLLDIVTSHDYHKSRFIHLNVLRAFIRKRVLSEIGEGHESLSRAIDAPNEILPAEYEKKTTKETCYIPLEIHNHQLIQLSNEQKNAITCAKPAIVYGPAGSGKTCIAFPILFNFLNIFGSDPGIKPAVYIAQSDRLVANMKHIWKTIIGEEAALRGPVLFMTYKELLQQALIGTKLEGAHIIENDEAYFYNWFSEHIDTAASMGTGCSVAKLHERALGLWHEFRICSALTKEAYNQLGKRGSAFFGDDRGVIYDQYKHYESYLSYHHIVSPALHKISKPAQYQMLIVDEAQDLSYRQLNTLYELTSSNQIIYCMGDHQTLGDGKSRHIYLKAMLTLHCGKSPTELALTTTYRCSEHVTLIANRFIELKHRVTGGKADKIESNSLSLVPRADLGEVLWIEKSHDPRIEGLRKEAEHPDFAIVTLPEHKEEARIFFGTPLVFTPEEIKGLEYLSIVVYKMLDTDILRRANTELKTSSAATPKHRAKAGKENDFYRPYFNQLFTAVTRALRKLVFMQPDYNPHHLSEIIPPLIELIKPLNTGAAAAPATKFKAVSLIADWEDQAIEQFNLGNEDLAQEICRTHLGISNKADFMALIYRLQDTVTEDVAIRGVAKTALETAPVSIAPVHEAASPLLPLAESLPPKTSSKASKKDDKIPTLPPSSTDLPFIHSVFLDFDKRGMMHLFIQQDYIDLFCHTPIIHKGSNKSLLHHILTSSDKMELFLKSLNTTPFLINKLAKPDFFTQVFKIIKKNSITNPLLVNNLFIPLIFGNLELLRERQIQSWFKQALSEKILGKPEQHLFYRMAEESIKNINLFNLCDLYCDNWFFSLNQKILLENQGKVFVFLMVTHQGRQLLLYFYDTILVKLPPDVWASSISFSEGNFTILYHLFKSDLCNELLEKFPLEVFLSVPKLLWNAKIDRKGTLTPLDCAIENKCYKIFELLPFLKNEIQGSIWKLIIDSSNNSTVLYSYLVEPDGCNFISTLSDEVRSRIPAEAWDMVCSDSDEGHNNSLFAITRNVDGPELLDKLSEEELSRIPKEAWSRFGSGGNSAFFRLAVLDHYKPVSKYSGRRILSTLSPEALSNISPAVWSERVPNKGDLVIVDANMTPFWGLSRDELGLSILEKLSKTILANISILALEPVVQSVRKGDDLSSNTSALYHLARSPKGQKILLKLDFDLICMLSFENWTRRSKALDTEEDTAYGYLIRTSEGRKVLNKINPVKLREIEKALPSIKPLSTYPLEIAEEEDYLNYSL